ncbi:hypothetical protein GN956_G6203 [Arapaima gigas]
MGAEYQGVVATSGVVLCLGYPCVRGFSQMASAQSLATDCELQPDGSQGGHAGASQDGDGAVGGDHNIYSVSPCPVDLPTATPEIQPREFALWDGDSVDGEPHHASPLESITELDEAEELQTPPLKPEERTVTAGDILKEVGVLSKSTLPTGDTHDEREKLKSPTVDILMCPKTTAVNGFFTTECRDPQTARTWDEEKHLMVESKFQPEQERPKWHDTCEAHCNISIVKESLRKDLDSTVLTPDGLQDPKLQQEFQEEDSRERILELEDELSSEMKKESHIKMVPQLESETQDSCLAEVLTECKLKVEQLEDLKYTSMDLKNQLQVAQATAAFLQRQMLILEEAHRQKQQEVLELTGALQEAKEALREKSALAAQAAMQLQAISRDMGGKQKAGSLPEEAPANSHAVAHSPPRSHSDSRVCTLL